MNKAGMKEPQVISLEAVIGTLKGHYTKATSLPMNCMGRKDGCFICNIG